MFNLIKPVLAVQNDIIGSVDVPTSVITNTSQVGPFLSVVVRLLIVISGIWALLQFLLAGLGYITAGGDAKKVQEAYQKITYSVIGLVVIGVSFIVVTIVGRLLFGSGFNILSPTLQTL